MIDLSSTEAINVAEWMSPERVASIVRIAIVILIGVPASSIVASLVARSVRKRFTEQSAMLVRKGIFYAGLLLVLLMLLRELGFSITALLGAAGIAGIAVGFAAQTSLSNLISGIFLITEKPFQVGDLIKVGDTAGIVLSIDLLSVKLRKFDNTFVRIPNESLIKGELTNVTRFPIRRFDLNMGVAYREDISRAINVLKEIADDNPYALDEPAPMVAFTGFGDSALNIFMGVWFSKTDYLALRDSLLPEIKRRFDEEGIEIPFPHRTVYTGSMSEPFPIQVIQPDKAEDAAEAENLR